MTIIDTLINTTKLNTLPILLTITLSPIIAINININIPNNNTTINNLYINTVWSNTIIYITITNAITINIPYNSIN